MSKLCAFREKDQEFVGALVQANIVRVRVLDDRLATVPDLDPVALTRARGWLAALPES